jgi:proliferating cell nuclear antigen
MNNFESIEEKFTEKNELTIKTIQIPPLKTLSTALKDLFIEVNMIFTKNGIYILQMDKSNNVLFNMELLAEKFEFYNIKKSKIIITYNSCNFNYLIESINDGDVLTIYIEECDYLDGIVSYLTLRFENKKSNRCTTQKLKLQDSEIEDLVYPEVTFSSIITFPSEEFSGIIKYLHKKYEKVEIKSVGNELYFISKNECFNVSIKLVENEKNLKFINKPDPTIVFQNEYLLKHLNSFIKCTNLSPSIELMLENSLPLVIKYHVADLGKILLCLVNHTQK